MPEQTIIRASLKYTAQSLELHDDEAVNSRRIEGIDNLPPLFLARGQSGCLLVMTQCHPNLNASRDFLRTTVRTANFRQNPDGPATTMLVAECKESNYEEQFLDLISAVVSSISFDGGTPDFANNVFMTIVRWAELFERFTEKDVTLQQAAGILAELLAVARVVRVTGDVSLNFWSGPQGLPHDIVLESHALEIKAVTTTSISRISINGLQQLDPSPSEDLYVAVTQIRDEAGTVSISGIYEEIVSLGADRLHLMGLVQNEGISISSKWWNHKLAVLAEELFLVDSKFPKIIPGTITGDFELSSIESVKYSVQVGSLTRHATVDPVGKWLSIHDF